MRNLTDTEKRSALHEALNAKRSFDTLFDGIRVEYRRKSRRVYAYDAIIATLKRNETIIHVPEDATDYFYKRMHDIIMFKKS